MNCNNSNSTSESTQNNSQKTGFNANDTANSMGWSKEQLEILQQCHEEKIANEEMYNSLPEPHKFSCNCVECN